MALSVEDLRAFSLVVRHRSVSKTAGLLGVAQQSVSERIRRLEKRLDADLFVRLPHGMEPTAAGYRLLPYAERAVQLIDQAAQVVTDDDLFRVRVQSGLSEVVGSFVEQALSGFQFELAEAEEGRDIVEAIAEGAADIGFGAFLEAEAESQAAAAADARPDPTAGWRSAVTVEAFFADPVVCVAPAGSPMAQRPLRLSDIGAAGIALDGRMGEAAGDVQVCARSRVAGRLASGQLVELNVADWPNWVVPVSLAYRTGEADRPPIKALRAATTPGGQEPHGHPLVTVSGVAREPDDPGIRGVA